MSISVALAQDPVTVVRQAVDAERAANQADHSNWIYFEDFRKPKEHVLQWVASTQQGDIYRVLERDGQRLAEPQQRGLINEFLQDRKAQKKQLAERSHDNQQVDDFLQLLPTAFRWKQTGVTPTETVLHFEPDPNFHPPTREARVFSEMTGDLTVDHQQHRIRSLSGHLLHDVTFGAGLLGRLKEGSSFSLEQMEVGQSLWELTAIHVHLEGNALLFKSVSLQQDNERSKFEPEAATLTLDQAVPIVMAKPD